MARATDTHNTRDPVTATKSVWSLDVVALETSPPSEESQSPKMESEEDTIR